MEYLGAVTTSKRNALAEGKGTANLTTAFGSLDIRRPTTLHGNSTELYVKTGFQFPDGEIAHKLEGA